MLFPFFPPRFLFVWIVHDAEDDIYDAPYSRRRLVLVHARTQSSLLESRWHSSSSHSVRDYACDFHQTAPTLHHYRPQRTKSSPESSLAPPVPRLPTGSTGGIKDSSTSAVGGDKMQTPLWRPLLVLLGLLVSALAQFPTDTPPVREGECDVCRPGFRSRRRRMGWWGGCMGCRNLRGPARPSWPKMFTGEAAGG